MENSGERTPIQATIWSAVERVFSEIVVFGIGICLARLLSPHDYGVIGAIAIFIAISAVIIESGFGNALIRKQNFTEEDLSTAFIFNSILGLLSYIILWIFAPLIACFFNENILTNLVRIVGLNVFICSLSIVPNAILTAKLNIRLQTIINLVGQLLSGALTIFLALRGWGVYSLAIQSVSGNLVKTLLLWHYVKWLPTCRFDRESFKYLWSFGSKLVAATLIGTIFSQIYSVLIGKYIGKNELGFFSKARNLADHTTNIPSGIIHRVAIPILARYQNDVYMLKVKFRESIRLLFLIMAPIASFCVLYAEEIITLLWTNKWEASIPMFQLLVLGMIWEPVSQLSLSLLQVVNKTGTILKLEFPKKTIYFIIILIAFNFGIYGLLVGIIAINIVGALINTYPTKSILDYPYLEQFLDILRYVFIAFLLGFLQKALVNIPYGFINTLLLFLLYLLLYCSTLMVIKDTVFISCFQKAKKYINVNKETYFH